MRRGGKAVAAILTGIWLGAFVLADAAGARNEQPRFVPGELLVRFEAGVSRPEEAAVLRELGAEPKEELPVPEAKVVELSPGEGVRHAAAAFERRPGVRFAEPNYLYRPDVFPNDPLFGEQAGLHNVGQPIGGGPPGLFGADINAPEAWDVTAGDPSVLIAIVDVGFDLTHPDLAPNLVPGWDFAGDILGNDDPDPRPDPLGDNHGTHVAGIAGAAGDNGEGVAGVSWNSRLLPLKVERPTGAIVASDVAQAFSYAAGQGARIVNASLGGPGVSATIESVIEGAPETLFVVSAGNDASDVDSAFTQYPCESNAANVICVTATGHDDMGAFGFANWGSTSVDLAAPGRGILSTVRLTDEGYAGGPYGFKTGTSMATPHVTGAAALLLAQTPGASTAQIRGAILSSVEPLPSLAGRTATGGRLDAASALIVDTVITKAPKRKSRKRKAKFEFESPNHEPAGFDCRLDRKGAFKPCSDRAKFRVSRGRHKLTVAAIDGLGRQDPTPAVYTWRVKRRR
jgi:subtilisin family serine protease